MIDEEERIARIASNARSVLEWKDIPQETRDTLEELQRESRRISSKVDYKDD